jgi:hypothetical protein
MFKSVTSVHPAKAYPAATAVYNSLEGSPPRRLSRTQVIPIPYTDAAGKHVPRPGTPPGLRAFIVCYPKPILFGITMSQFHHDKLSNHRALQSALYWAQRDTTSTTNVVLVDDVVQSVACKNAFKIFAKMQEDGLDVKLYTSCVRK